MMISAMDVENLKPIPSKAAVNFQAIFSLQGKNLTAADQAVGQILLEATTDKKVAELSYQMIEDKLKVKKSHTTTWRNIKKLSPLFEVTVISCQVSNDGANKRNILQVKRSPDFDKIIKRVNI